MRLSKLAKLCKNDGRLTLYTVANQAGEVTEQWAGTGAALYPLWGLPVLNGEQLENVFGWSEKEKNSVVLTEKSCTKAELFEDNAPEDRLLERAKVGLLAWGREVSVLRDAGKVLFVDTDTLSPVLDEMGKLEFYRRKDKIAIKRGMELVGLVAQLVPAADLQTQLDVEAICERMRQGVKR